MTKVKPVLSNHCHTNIQLRVFIDVFITESTGHKKVAYDEY